ncbi:MAG: hypothetical protein ACI4MM_03265 [Candidatus Ventricola sp.]
MPAYSDSIRSWAADAQWQTFPQSPRALGELTAPNGEKLLTLAFETHRDIICAIGYRREALADDALCACTAALCSLVKGKAVMAADLLGPSEIAEALRVDMDDALFYQAVLAVLCLKNALSSYADTRAADYAAYKQENP